MIVVSRGWTASHVCMLCHAYPTLEVTMLTLSMISSKKTCILKHTRAWFILCPIKVYSQKEVETLSTHWRWRDCQEGRRWIKEGKMMKYQQREWDMHFIVVIGHNSTITSGDVLLIHRTQTNKPEHTRYLHIFLFFVHVLHIIWSWDANWVTIMQNH